MQFTLINHFTAAERALLHATLLHVLNENKTNRKQQIVQDAIEGFKGPSKLFEEFYKYTDTTMQSLIHKLFADCFLEDLEFVKEFAKEYKAALKSNTVLAHGE